MKLLLVMSSDESYSHILIYVKPLGFDFIRYNYVHKAMDNIEEIDPAALIISANDFPRQWKTMVQFVRSERSKENCPIIILSGENFSTEEALKASFLGVSGIIPEALDRPSEINRLKEILGRYLPVNERRRTRRIQTEGWQRFGFIFSRPNDKIMISGEVKDISIGGFSFLADNPSLMDQVFLDMELEECSFRAGDTILSPVCRLARTGRIVSLEFISFPDGEQEVLSKYIENLPLLELSLQRDKKLSQNMNVA